MNNAWITISTVSSVFLWNELVVPTDRWPIMIFFKICFACAANLTRKATEAGGTRGILDASQNAAYEEDFARVSPFLSPLARHSISRHCELHVRRVLSGRCVRGAGVKSGDWYWSRLANLDFRTSQASPWFVAGVRRCHIVTTKEVHMLTCYSLWSTVIVGLPRALTRTLTYSSSSSRLGHKAALPRTKFLK